MYHSATMRVPEISGNEELTVISNQEDGAGALSNADSPLNESDSRRQSENTDISMPHSSEEKYPNQPEGLGMVDASKSSHKEDSPVKSHVSPYQNADSREISVEESDLPLNLNGAPNDDISGNASSDLDDYDPAEALSEAGNHNSEGNIPLDMTKTDPTQKEVLRGSNNDTSEHCSEQHESKDDFRHDSSEIREQEDSKDSRQVESENSKQKNPEDSTVESQNSKQEESQNSKQEESQNSKRKDPEKATHEKSQTSKQEEPEISKQEEPENLKHEESENLKHEESEYSKAKESGNSKQESSEEIIKRDISDNDDDYDPEVSISGAKTPIAAGLPAKPSTVDISNSGAGAKASLRQAYEAVINSEVVQSKEFAELPKEQQMVVIEKLLLGKNIALPSDPEMSLNDTRALRHPTLDKEVTEQEQQDYKDFLDSQEAERRSEGFPQDSRLFVGNLPAISEFDMFRIFSQYGKVEEISLKAGYGFVQYNDAESCNSAIRKENGAVLCGRVLRLDTSRSRRDVAQPAKTRGRERNAKDEAAAKRRRTQVDVKIFPSEDTESDLLPEIERHFSLHGITYEVVPVDPSKSLECVQEAAYSGVLGACVVESNKANLQTFEETDDGVKFDEYEDIKPSTICDIIINTKKKDVQERPHQSQGRTHEDEGQSVRDSHRSPNGSANFNDRREDARQRSHGGRHARRGRASGRQYGDSQYKAYTFDQSYHPQDQHSYGQGNQRYQNPQFPNQQYPNQQYPNQQYPNQQYPNQQYPNQQYPNQQYPNQQYPNQQYPNQQYPNQSFPNQSFPNQQYPNQFYTNQQYPNQQYPNQQYPNQQYPNQSFPNQVYSNQQYPNQPYLNQPYLNQPYSNQPFSNQPYQSQPYTKGPQHPYLPPGPGPQHNPNFSAAEQTLQNMNPSAKQSIIALLQNQNTGSSSHMPDLQQGSYPTETSGSSQATNQVNHLLSQLQGDSPAPYRPN